jgi:hypothetical protein
MPTTTIATRTKAPYAIVELLPAKPERPGYEGRTLPATPATARIAGYAYTAEAARMHAEAKARTHYFRIEYRALPVTGGRVEVLLP